MRTHWVAIALVLEACGGSARSGPHASDSAGAPSGGVPESSDAGGQPTSNAGEPTRGGASGAGGDSSGAGADVAGAGGEATGCVGLACLAGAHLVYQPTRTWHAPAGPINAGELAEADYTPLQGSPIKLTFSADALDVQLEPTAGGATVLGARNPAQVDRAWYELELFAGGRFVVQLAADGHFEAEHTVYGSGAPIVSSTRGLLKDEP